MTTEEKRLQFLADRLKDEKEFHVDNQAITHCFRNSILKNVRYEEGERIETYSQMLLNTLLRSSLKLKKEDLKKEDLVSKSSGPNWKFTEKEKEILRLVDDRFQWIARNDYTNDLFIYTDKPEQRGPQYATKGKGISNDLSMYNHLFKSIKWSDNEPCEFRKYI